MDLEGKTKKYVLVIIALIFAGVIIFLLIEGTIIEKNPGNYSEEQIASNSLRDFLGESAPGIELVGIETTHYGDFYKFTSGNGGEYYVDATTHTVSRATFPFDWDETKEVRMSMDDAEKKAREFISEKDSKSDIDGFDTIESRLLDHVSYKEYQFVFQEVKDGVLLFNSAVVSVNPSTGDVISYMSVNKKLEVSLIPEISEEEAMDIAMNQFGDIRLINNEARLIVDYPDGVEQRLLWNIMIEGEPENYVLQGGTVTIDAITGRVYSKSSFL